MLDTNGVAYRVNPKLVRGLDYYSKTVFEWVTDKLGAQGTVCAGGRYDGLVEQLGGKPTTAVGFAMGIERLVLLLETLNALPESIVSQPDVYIMAVGDVSPYALQVAEQLREACPSLRFYSHCGGGSVKSQIKKADKSQADIAVLIGQDEYDKQQVTIKFLRQAREQQTLSLSDAITLLNEH